MKNIKGFANGSAQSGERKRGRTRTSTKGNATYTWKPEEIPEVDNQNMSFTYMLTSIASLPSRPIHCRPTIDFMPHSQGSQGAQRQLTPVWLCWVGLQWLFDCEAKGVVLATSLPVVAALPRIELVLRWTWPPGHAKRYHRRWTKRWPWQKKRRRSSSPTLQPRQRQWRKPRLVAGCDTHIYVCSEGRQAPVVHEVFYGVFIPGTLRVRYFFVDAESWMFTSFYLNLFCP